MLMSNWDPFPDCPITLSIAFSSCVAKSEDVADEVGVFAVCACVEFV
jgi:hypothetical protein